MAWIGTTPSNLCYYFYDPVWLHIVPLYTLPAIKRASLHLSNGFYMGYQTGQLIGLKSECRCPPCIQPESTSSSTISSYTAAEFINARRKRMIKWNVSPVVFQTASPWQGLLPVLFTWMEDCTSRLRLEEKIPHKFDRVRNLGYCKLQCIRIWLFYAPFSFRLRIL